MSATRESLEDFNVIYPGQDRFIKIYVQKPYLNMCLLTAVNNGIENVLLGNRFKQADFEE